jgi:hypothetical protein
VVCVFARKTSEPLASLVKQIDEKIGENGQLKSFVVIVPKKGDKPADDLKKLAHDAGIKHVPLTIGESPDGPPDYELAKDAEITVLMWKQHTVRVNHAYKGALTGEDVRAIVADIPKVLNN